MQFSKYLNCAKGLAIQKGSSTLVFLVIYTAMVNALQVAALVGISDLGAVTSQVD